MADRPDGQDRTGQDRTGQDVVAHRSRVAGLWLKIVLFAAGVVVGVLAVGLLDSTTPDFAEAQAGSGPAPGGASPSGGGAGAEARVNAACLAVINDAQDVYAVLTDLGPALDDTDLMALDDIVRRLQPVEPRLATDLRGCRVDTSVGSGTTTSPGATPTAPTTAVPTPVVPTPVVPTPVAPTSVVPTSAPTVVAPSSTAPTAPPTAPLTPPGRAPGVVVLR